MTSSQKLLLLGLPICLCFFSPTSRSSTCSSFFSELSFSSSVFALLVFTFNEFGFEPINYHRSNRGNVQQRVRAANLRVDVDRTLGLLMECLRDDVMMSNDDVIEKKLMKRRRSSRNVFQFRNCDDVMMSNDDVIGCKQRY